MSDFETQTAVTAIGNGAFKATVDKRWWVVRGPHGGYLAAIILRALSDTQTDPRRHPRSFTTHFLAAPHEGDLEIHVTTEREGRSVTTLSARTVQGDRTVALSLAAYSAEWDGFAFDDAPMPEVASPDEAFVVPTEGENMPPFLANFDMRWVFGGPPLSGSDEALVGGWLRTRAASQADPPAVAALMDAWAPAIFPRATEPVVAPTIDFTVHFRSALPADGAEPEDFYLGRFSSRLGRDGFFEEDGELWTHDGTLIAQSRQLALGLFTRR